MNLDAKVVLVRELSGGQPPLGSKGEVIGHEVPDRPGQPIPTWLVAFDGIPTRYLVPEDALQVIHDPPAGTGVEATYVEAWEAIHAFLLAMKKLTVELEEKLDTLIQGGRRQ